MPLSKNNNKTSPVQIALDIARRAKRAAGGQVNQTPWYQRDEARHMTKNPVIGSSKSSKITPLVIKGNPINSTPLGQAFKSMPKAGGIPKPQFPKLPSAPKIKLPKAGMKDGGEVESRTEAAAHGPLLGSTPGRADKISTKVEDGSYIIPADIPSSSALGEGNSLAGHAKLLKLFPHSDQSSLKSAFKRGGAAEQSGHVDCALSDGEFRVSKADCLKLGGGDLAKAHRILDHFVMNLRHHNIESLKTLPGPAQSDE